MGFTIQRKVKKGMAEIKLGKKTAYTTIITPKGELTGFNAVFEPSVKFNKKGVFNASIILSKENGEYLLELVKEVQKTQFKEFKEKGSKLTEITAIKPLSEINEETGEETFDTEGRYILKAKNSARIENGLKGFQVAVFDSKLKPVKKINLGEGSIVKLKLDIAGYTVAGKVGVSVRLVAVQIIEFVPYTGSVNAAEGFDVECEGFDFDEEAQEATEAEEAATGATEDEEEAF